MSNERIGFHRMVAGGLLVVLLFGGAVALADIRLPAVIGDNMVLQQGGKGVVSSEQVAAPVAVRYAWADNPICNLYNKEGLPASPFRTDDWPGQTVNAR